jgi:large subunit ribosomal protein L35
MLKTNRSVAKRFRFTGKGKIKRPKAYKGHLLGCKTKKRKRHLRKGALVSPRDAKRLRRMLPYG